MTEIQAKVWLRARARYLERDLGPSPIFMKKGVNRLQQDGLPSLCHLRELRFHSESAMKIEDLPIEAVLTRHISVGAGNLKLQGRERKNSVVQFERTLKIRRDGLVRCFADEIQFSATAKTYVVDSALQFFVVE